MQQAARSSHLGHHQQQQLAANCSSGAYAATTGYLSLLLDLTINLSRFQTDRLLLGRPLEPSRVRRLLVRLSIVLLHYSCVKAGVAAWIYYAYGTELKLWRPEAHLANVQTNGDCMLASSRAIQDDTLAKIVHYRAWIMLVSPLGISVTGTVSMLLNLVSIFSLVYSVLGFAYLRSRPFNLDSLQFLYEPLAVRRLFALRMAHLVDALIQLSRMLPVNPRTCRALRPPARKLHNRMKLMQLEHQQFKDCNQIDQLLQNTCWFQLAQPANLTAEWHRRVLDKLRYAFSIILVSGTAFTLLVLFGLQLSDSAYRAQHRYKTLRCQRWSPNATLVRAQAIELERLDNPAHRATFQRLAERADVGWLDLLLQGVPIEFRFELSLRRLINVVEYSLLAIIMQAFVWFFLLIYLASLADKHCWLAQIRGQLDESIRLLERDYLLGEQARSGAGCKLIKLSIVNYLSFNLFRDRFADFRRLTNLAIAQLSFCLAQVMFFCYLASTHTDTKQVMLMAACLVYLLMLINIYLITGSHLLGKHVKMMHRMAHMVALLSSRRDQSSRFLQKIWNRQVMSKRELDVFFSFHSLGASVSFDKLIIVNAYMVGLWLILFGIVVL